MFAIVPVNKGLADDAIKGLIGRRHVAVFLAVVAIDGLAVTAQKMYGAVERRQEGHMRKDMLPVICPNMVEKLNIDFADAVSTVTKEVSSLATLENFKGSIIMVPN